MADDVPKLEIFGDSPTTEDGLGFDDYADILLGVIGNFDARSPLTIGIHGRWGSGKTSLMRMLEKRFRSREDVKTIWFNAWAYGDELIGLALLQQILNEFQKEEKLTVKGIRLLGNIGKLGTDAFLRKTTTITLKEAENLFESSVGIKSTLRDDFEAAIGECLEDGGRLVVFIDDLDRCLPEKAIEILEVIKLFLDVSKCIFVIGVEKEVIEKGIEVRYKSKDQKPISGKDYIEKIIQVPFTLPPIREDNMAAFIENLGIGGVEKGYIKIVAKGAGCNPRKVKMFLNALIIRQAIVEKTGGGIKPDLSAKFFVFEYVFHEFYRDVVKYKDQYLLCKLERLAKGKSGEKLKGELKSSETLKKYHKNEDLSSLLRDEPFFNRTDIEPYIHLSGTEAYQEIAVSDESTQNELLSGDSMKLKRAADAINKMLDLEKQQFLDRNISELEANDVPAPVHKNAAWALGEIGDKRAVDALKKALKDEAKDALVRGNAAWALGKIGDKRAVDALVDAMGLRCDECEYVRKLAAWALGKIGDKRAVEVLVEGLKDEDKDVRRYASTALGRIGDKRAVEVLVEVLKDEDKDVRRYASTALGRIGDKRAVEALVEVLKGEEVSVYVRKHAAEALGCIGDSKAVETLIRALKYGHEYVREAAAEALGRIGDSKAVETLIVALKDEEEVVVVRGNAVRALGAIGDTRAVEALEEALKDEDKDVCKYASEALTKIKAKQNQ